MGELIIFNERYVKPKGLNKAALPNETKIKEYIFIEDYRNLQLLGRIPKIKLADNIIVLFYPGCGSDILFPLKYVEFLFPEIKKIKFIFNDLGNTLGLIKTVLDDIGISFSEEGNNKISFYWNNLLVNLEFVIGDVLEVISHLSYFDIYFERSFRIMREQLEGYEMIVYNKLNKMGVLISDSGYQSLNLKRVEVPLKLSSYEEMIIGLKTTPKDIDN